MFETEIEDYGESIISQFHDRFFPVEFDKKENVLTIIDKRPENFFYIGGFIILILNGLFILSFAPLLIYSFLGILTLAALVGGFGFLSFKFFRMPYKKMFIFDKKQGIFRIIKFTPGKAREIAGKLDQINKLKIEITEYVSSEDRQRTNYFQTFIVINDATTNELKTIPLEENSSSRNKISVKIAFSITDFLQISAPEVVQL